MKSLSLPISACRYCRYYQPEGRRGGMCQILEVPVHGNWKACALAIPTFASAWEALEEMMMLPDVSPLLASSPVVCAIDASEIESSGSEVSYSTEQKKEKPLLV